MFARLAGRPLGRELFPFLVTAAFVGGIGIAAWAWTPAATPSAHFFGRILTLTVSPDTKYHPAGAVIDVELAARRRITVSTVYSRVSRCKVGDSVRLTSVRAMSGGLMTTVDPGACR
jgi:hypothetical protein